MRYAIIGLGAMLGANLRFIVADWAAARWGAAGRRLFEQQFQASRMARETAAIYEEALRDAAIREQSGQLAAAR